MKALAELAKEALELPTVQRRQLARILLELSEDPSDFSPDADGVWEKEICRRMDDVKTGAACSSAFDEVFARLDQRSAQ